MKVDTLIPTRVIFIALLLLQASCSKDSDLLADYVAADPLQGLNGPYVVNDSFTLALKSSSTLDVLRNDKFKNRGAVKVLKTTSPVYGEVTINEDNTLTYTSTEDSAESLDDTFTYTTEETLSNGETNTEEGTVSITLVEDPAPVTGDMGELAAFPGAEGFGKYATGGRGGYVVEVTNTNCSGPGSFQAALEMKGARTIVFRVGGTISCSGSNYLQIPPGSGDVTIAGESAPGDGILIRGARLSVRASNVIIRHIRFRQDPSTSSGSNDDAVTIDGTYAGPLSDIIIDHCSFSWGLDGNLDIRNTWGATVQNSIFSYNEKSNLINANSKNISYLNNIFALVNERAVRANTIAHLDLTYEMINNYVYGVNWPGGPSEGLKVTVQNNVCEASSEFSVAGSNFVELAAPNPDNKEPNTIENTYLYITGNNLGDAYSNEMKQGYNQYMFSQALYRSTYIPAPINNLKSYLVTNAGAYARLTQGRDAVDTEIISHINTKTGRIQKSGTFPNISNGTPYPDSDKDGMDDNWENAIGLNVGIADHNEDKDGNGYTSLEEFMFYLSNRN